MLSGTILSTDRVRLTLVASGGMMPVAGMFRKELRQKTDANTLQRCKYTSIDKSNFIEAIIRVKYILLLV